jgi:hypothetical protein
MWGSLQPASDWTSPVLRRQTPPTAPAPPRRRRDPRPLGLAPTIPDDRTAQAMDDEEAAEQLVADLLALVDAGLIAPVAEPGGAVRYGVAGEDDAA